MRKVDGIQEFRVTWAQTWMPESDLGESLWTNSRRASLYGMGKTGTARLILQARACQRDDEGDLGSRCDGFPSSIRRGTV
jgi:hypothetical protein